MDRFRHDRLLEARVSLGLTQEEAAAAVGVDVRTYRRYERGAVNDPEAGFSVRHAARRRLVEKMAAELGIDPSELVEADDRQSPRGSLADRSIAAGPGPHALPPAPQFVGRGALLAKLSDRIGSGEPGVVALVAVGGAGKTSLAERAVASHPEAFVWSFYRDERTEAMFDAALARFGRAGARGARADDLEAALRMQGGLLVLDGLEIVQAAGKGSRARGEIEDPALRRLLRAIAAGLGRTLLLITSRFAPVDLAPWEGRGFEIIAIGDLSAEESEQLLSTFGIERAGAIAARFGGHPLSLAVAGAYVRAFLDGDGQRLIEIDLEEASQEDPLARRLAAVVDAYADALSALDRDVLARLAVFPRGAAAETLHAIALAGGEAAGALGGADVEAIDRSLLRLVALGLAHRSGRTFGLHPFVAQLARRRLGSAAALVHRLEASRLSALLSELASAPSDPLALDRLEELLLHLLGADRSFEAAQLYLRVLGGFGNLGLELGDMIRGARITRALGEVTAIPEAIADVIRYDRGLYAGALGDLDLALASYALCREHARARNDLVRLTTALRTTAYTHRLAGDLVSARAAVEAAIDRAVELGDRIHLSKGLALLGAIDHDRGEIELAKEHFARVREIGDDPVARRGLWEAEHLFALGSLDEAERLTARNLEVCEARRWPGHAAHCRVVLGTIAAKRGDGAAARAHLDAVEGWTDRTGEVEMVLRAGELRGMLPGGEAAAREAAAKAERLGFLLFQARFARLTSSAGSASGAASGARSTPG